MARPRLATANLDKEVASLSSIHFIGGEKGGVGKSVTSRLLAQYHIDNRLAFRAFDSDRSHGAMMRFYADYAAPIQLDHAETVDQLVETALARPQNVIVDLAAQTSQGLFRWIDDSDLLGLAAEEDIMVCLWHLLDDGADGIALLSELTDSYGESVSYVVVKNRGRGKDFSAFDGSDARTDAIAAGAAVIELSELNAGTMRKVDHLNLSFWAAANNREAGLGLMERRRVKVWMARAYQQFAQVGLEIPTRSPSLQTPQLPADEVAAEALTQEPLVEPS